MLVATGVSLHCSSLVVVLPFYRRFFFFFTTNDFIFAAQRPSPPGRATLQKRATAQRPSPSLSQNPVILRLRGPSAGLRHMSFLCGPTSRLSKGGTVLQGTGSPKGNSQSPSPLSWVPQPLSPHQSLPTPLLLSDHSLRGNPTCLRERQHAHRRTAMESCQCRISFWFGS